MMDRSGTRMAGGVLVCTAAAALLAMSHHPTHLDAGPRINVVHGMLIALSVLIAYGFVHWSRLRGLDRPPVAAALVAYGVGLFGGIGAALLDGFVMTSLPHDGGVGDMHRLVWSANQALAYLGVIATGAAYALWSVDLLRPDGARLEKMAGLAGLAAGLVPLVLLATGMLRMNMSGALIVYGVQWSWVALVGLLMLSWARRVAA